MKPFNLDQALAGKPVLLRNGEKAHVKFVTPGHHRQIVGYALIKGRYEVMIWNADGGAFLNEDDIIGMYTETIRIGNINVPAPETEPPTEDTLYYFPLLTFEEKYGCDDWTNSKADNRLLKLGLVHLTEKGAVAHAKALLELTKTAIEEAG